MGESFLSKNFDRVGWMKIIILQKLREQSKQEIVLHKKGSFLLLPEDNDGKFYCFPVIILFPIPMYTSPTKRKEKEWQDLLNVTTW